MTKNFSLILPTRDRPMLVKRLFDSLTQTVGDPDQVEIVLYIDQDDVESRKISHPLLDTIRQIGPRPRKTMGNIVKDCYEASRGRYVMLINDDVVFHTKKWDVELLEAFSKFPDEVALVYGKDLYYGKEMATFPVLSRTACDLMDGICPGKYNSHCIDAHVFDTFKRLSELGHNRTVYLPNVVFEHMHYDLGASACEGGLEYKNDQDDQTAYLSFAEERQRTAVRMAQYIESQKNIAARTGDREVRKSRRSEPSEKAITKNATTASRQLPVSLIMPVNNSSLEYAAACLQAVLDDNKDKRLPYEFVIVADGEAAETSKYPRKIRSKMMIVSGEQTNTAATFNAGASVANGDYLVFLDSNAFPLPGWLRALVEAAQDEDVGIVGSKWLNPRNGAIEHVGIGFYKDNGALRGTHIYRGLAADHPAVSRTRQVQAVRRAGMLVKKNVFLEAGCFEAAIAGLDDIDLCLKVRQSGRKVICAPGAALYCESQDPCGKGAANVDNPAALLAKWDGHIECDIDKLLGQDGFLLRPGKKAHYIRPDREHIHNLGNGDSNPALAKELLEESLELIKSLKGDRKDLSEVCKELVDTYFSLGSDEDVHRIYKMMQAYGLSVPVLLTRYEQLVKTDRRNFGTVESVDMYAGTRFLVPVSTWVSQVELKMYKQGSPRDDIVARIYSDNAGPDKPVSQTASNPVSGSNVTSNPGGDWVRFTFPEPVLLSANTYYWIILHRKGSANNASHYKILLDSSPQCRYPYASDYYGREPTGGNISDRISQLFRVFGAVAPSASNERHNRNKIIGQKWGNVK
jgi:glycosyltransferase involved in cell wall biosynthesis